MILPQALLSAQAKKRFSLKDFTLVPPAARTFIFSSISSMETINPSAAKFGFKKSPNDLDRSTSPMAIQPRRVTLPTAPANYLSMDGIPKQHAGNHSSKSRAMKDFFGCRRCKRDALPSDGWQSLPAPGNQFDLPLSLKYAKALRLTKRGKVTAHGSVKY